MPVKFKIERLQPYRLKLDPDVRIRYQIITEEEAQAIREFASREGEIEEAEAKEMLRNMIQSKVVEMWHRATVYKDPEDIADTIMAAPAFRGEVLTALLNATTVHEEDAPF